MTDNEHVIHSFYKAFQKKDYVTMQNLYADNATFSDSVFNNLNANEVRATWEMLLTKSADLDLSYQNVKSNGNETSAEWTAVYTFSRTGNKVVNKIKASFVIENGKIIRHTDHFDFYKWAKQAFGFLGLALGWTTSFKTNIQLLAKKGLDDFIQNKKPSTNNV